MLRKLSVGTTGGPATPELTLCVQRGLSSLVLGDLHGHMLLAALAEGLLCLWHVHLHTQAGAGSLCIPKLGTYYDVRNAFCPHLSTKSVPADKMLLGEAAQCDAAHHLDPLL